MKMQQECLLVPVVNTVEWMQWTFDVIEHEEDAARVSTGSRGPEWIQYAVAQWVVYALLHRRQSGRWCDAPTRHGVPAAGLYQCRQGERLIQMGRTLVLCQCEGSNNSYWKCGWLCICPQLTQLSSHIPAVSLLVVLLLSLSSGVMLAMVTVIFCSSFLSSPHFSLTAFFITSSYLLMFFSITSHSFQISLNAVLPSHFHPPFSLHFLGISSPSISHSNVQTVLWIAVAWWVEHQIPNGVNPGTSHVVVLNLGQVSFYVGPVLSAVWPSTWL